MSNFDTPRNRNLGFDSSQGAERRLVDSARAMKVFLSQAPILANHDLTQDASHGIHQGRLGFEKPDVKGLGFDLTKLLIALVAGDRSSDDQLVALYPHIKGDVLVGRTNLLLQISDAVAILRDVSLALGFSVDELKKHLLNYDTAISFDGNKDKWNAHQNDVASQLAELM